MSLHSQNHHLRPFARASAQPQYAPDITLSPIHLELHLQFDIPNKLVTARAIWTIICKNPASQELVLDGVDLNIDSVKSEGQSLQWWQNHGKIHIRWDNEFKKAEVRKVEIQYSVQNPVAGLYFGGPSDLQPERGQFVISDHETTRARYWLPCIDHSNIRTPLDIYITHETEFEALSSGALMSCSPQKDGKSVSHWHLDTPCASYLLCVAVGEFTRFDDGEFDGAPIAAFAPKPCTTETLKRCFGPTKDIMDMITKRLGPMPWPKYYQFIAPGIGGAMENISLVSWDDFFQMDSTAHHDFGQRLDQINLHEMAHTWFGDLIVCRDYAHVWLKESWATYMEVVWMEDSLNENEARYELINKRRLYFSEVKNSYSRPIMTRTFDSAWAMYDLHLYPGGAVRLHMLRNLLGDDIFWSGTRNYIDTFANDVVETDDLRRCYEKASGISLAHFFDQWFCTAGHPHLNTKYTYSQEYKALTLSFKQSLKGCEKDTPYFKFVLDIAIQNQSDDWSHHSISIDGDNTYFKLSIEEEPKQVVLDPFSRAVTGIEFDPGEKILKNSLSATANPYLYGRIHAGETLLNSGRHRLIRWVENAFSSEPFWGVRLQWAKAFGNCLTPTAHQAIVNLLPHETHPQVQAALASALGNHPSHLSSESLHDFLERVDIGYMAREAALIAMGKQRFYVNWDDLMEGLSDTGWYGYVRRGATRALGHVKTQTAAQHLRDIVGSIQELPHIRMAACLALASSAKNLKDDVRLEAVDALCEALQADFPRLRTTAAKALGILPHQSAIPALESAKGLIEAQSHPIIDRALVACRKYSPNQKDGGAHKRIEALEETVQKLQRLVEQLEAKVEDSQTSSS
ncbi:MAG: M1 family aminopeptidase [Myxococcota bacterium]